LTVGTEISAGIIVNAAGASAAELTPGLDLKKIQGPLAITDRYPGFLRLGLLFCGLPVSFGQPCLKIAPWADAPHDPGQQPADGAGVGKGADDVLGGQDLFQWQDGGLQESNQEGLRLLLAGVLLNQSH